MNKLQREADSKDISSSNPPTKKEYDVVRGNNSTELAVNVDKLLNTGWECQGGVTVIKLVPGSHVYYQAMIKN